MVKYSKMLEKTKNLTVLFIEDDENFRIETKEILEKIFFHVETATNGLEALDKYSSYYKRKKIFYDIVITDINMPISNGIELTEKIYSLNQYQFIIVISAHEESDYLLSLVNLGIEQFLTKPLELEKLIETFNNVAIKVLNAKTLKLKENIIQLKHNFNWDQKNNILLNHDKQINLSKNEIILMNILVKNNQKISSNEEMIDKIFHGSYDKTSENLKPIISRFRKKTQQTVENIYGLGYRMIF